MGSAAGVNARVTMPFGNRLKRGIVATYQWSMIGNKAPFSFRLDRDVPAFSDIGPICVMDAQCALCAKGAGWIARHDHRREFRIIPLQSDLGRALMRHYDLDPEDPNSWLYLENGIAHSAFDALIRVARRLGGIWHGLRILGLIPRGLRDPLYRLVARNRYRWFGRADLCALPDPAVRERLMQ